MAPRPPPQAPAFVGASGSNISALADPSLRAVAVRVTTFRAALAERLASVERLALEELSWFEEQYVPPLQPRHSTRRSTRHSTSNRKSSAGLVAAGLAEALAGHGPDALVSFQAGKGRSLEDLWCLPDPPDDEQEKNTFEHNPEKTFGTSPEKSFERSFEGASGSAAHSAQLPHSSSATWGRQVSPDEGRSLGSRISMMLEAAKIKQKEKTTLVNSLSNFAHRFRTDSKIQAMALDSAMGFVILLNAVVVGFSIDVGKNWRGWLFIDTVFACTFALEVLVRLIIAGLREYVLGPDRAWNVFDTFLAASAVFEVIIAFSQESAGVDEEASKSHQVLQSLRLGRVLRLVRLCRLEIFNDLKGMIKGATGGIRTLGWSTVLISFPLYTVALVCRQTLGPLQDEGSGAETFSSLPLSFFTVFRCTVVGECTDSKGRPVMYLVTERYGWIFGAMYCVVQVFCQFGLFNVIVALFVENVIAGARTNEQLRQRERLANETFFLSKMTQLIEVIMGMHNANMGLTDQQACSPEAILEQANELEITPEFFEQVRQNLEFTAILADLDVADEDSFNLFQTLDVDGSGTLDVEELFDGVARLRGDARRSDIVNIGLQMERMSAEFKDFCQASLATLYEHGQTLSSLQTALFPFSKERDSQKRTSIARPP